MKKILYALILIFLFIPIIKADYKIENYRIDVTVLEDGNLEIQESFKMNGPYNGYERIIHYKDNYNGYLGSIISSVENIKLYDGSGIKLNEVRATNFDLNSDFLTLQQNGDLFKKTSTATKGNYGVYTITKLENGEKYKIYNSSIMNKDFYINYTLENIGISHADVSEVPFNLSEFKESIKELEIYIHIPNNEKILQAWIHNIENKLDIIDINTLKIIISDIKVNDSFDFRIICDKNDNYKKKTNEIAYNKILKIEEELNKISNDTKDKEYQDLKSLAYDSVLNVEKTLNRQDYNYALKSVSSLKEEDNLKTELIIKLMNIESKVLRHEMLTKLFYTSILFSWFVIIIIICYYIYKKYDKEYKVTFKQKRIDYMPSNISVSSIGYLFRKRVNNNDLKASILNLIYNENIKFSKSTEKDFVLRKMSTNNLNDSDLKIMKLLFENKKIIKFSKIKERISNNYTEFLNNYSNWITKSILEAEELEYYEDIILPKILGIITSLIGFVIGVLFINKDTYFPSYIVLIFSILTLIYFVFLNKKTAKGDEEIAKWKAFKNYLDNYNKTTKDNNIDELNRYLVYSIVFNNYDKVSKSISLKYKNTKIYKQLNKNIYMNDQIIKAVDKLLSKAYSNKNIDYLD